MGIISTIAGGIAGMFVKKITSTVDDGTETEQRKVRAFPVAAFGVFSFALLHYFYIWPLLNHFFPDIEFPAIDVALMSVLAGLLP